MLDSDIKHLEDSLAAAKTAKEARTGKAEANVCHECGEVFDDADLYKHIEGSWLYPENG